MTLTTLMMTAALGVGLVSDDDVDDCRLTVELVQVGATYDPSTLGDTLGEVRLVPIVFDGDDDDEDDDDHGEDEHNRKREHRDHDDDDGRGERACTPDRIKLTPVAGSMFEFRRSNASLDYAAVDGRYIERASRSEIVINSEGRRTLGEGRAITVGLFDFLAGQFIPAGQYQGRVSLSVGRRQGEEFELSYDILPSLRFAPAMGGLVKTMSFGDVTSGAQQTNRILFLSNAKVAVSVQSENEGVLVHEDGRAFGTIDYRAQIASQDLDLGQGTVRFDRPFVGTGVQDWPFVVTIPPQANKFAGTYRDVVTVQITPY